MPSNNPYPYDATGVRPSNKILNEPRSILITNAVNAYLIVPEAAPFYGNSLVIAKEDGSFLVPGVDYYLSHLWQQATDVTGQEIYGSITLLSGFLPGVYNLSYQTIGGNYALDKANAIQSGVTATASDYITVDWSTAPTSFPPSPHNHELSGLSGMTEIYHSLNRIANSIKGGINEVHYSDVNGIAEVNVASNVDPYLDMIQSVNTLFNTNADMIINLSNQQKRLCMDVAPVEGLQHYSIPLPCGFILKVGIVTYYTGSEPLKIVFAKPIFPNTCIFATCTIGFAGSNHTVNHDRIYTGRPTTSGVRITIEYDGTPNYTTRTITYLAIGN